MAITRARRHLAVVGDSETISHHDFLKSFFEYVVENGEVRSVESYTKTLLDAKQDNAADEQTELMMKDFGMLNRVKKEVKYDGSEDVDRGAKSKVSLEKYCSLIFAVFRAKSSGVSEKICEHTKMTYPRYFAKFFQFLSTTCPYVAYFG